MIKRIKVFLVLRRMGIRHPWKASGDRGFISWG